MRRGFGRGFTLLEIMVALAIIAIVAAASVAALKYSSRTQLRTTAVDMVGALRLARNRAWTLGRSTTFRVNVERQTYQASGEPGPHDIPRKLHVSLYTARSLVEGTSAGAIRFFPDGTSTGGRITLSVPGRHSTSIDVDWLTGSVRILSPQGTPGDS